MPGEETTMQMMANPESLCGLSIVDKSVLVKEPGKILTADKVNTGTSFCLFIVSHVTTLALAA